MLSKMPFAAAILLTFSSVAFASTAIGTASAAGTIRVDGYAVTGNATLFDGSAIEAIQTPATLRLTEGTQIKLAPGSQGTLYRDRMVLNCGKSELSASDTFRVESNGLRITATGSTAHGIVAVTPSKTIQVAALSGDLQVANSTGFVLARIRSGSAMSFAAQAASGTVTLKGTVSSSNGNYYITASDGTITQITGKDFAKYVGKEVRITGTTVAGTSATGGASSVVDVSSISRLGAAGAGGGGGAGGGWTTADIVVTGIGGGLLAGAIAYGIYNTTASR